MAMSKLESELKGVVDKFMTDSSRFSETAYPMKLAQLNHDLSSCINKLVNSFTDTQKIIYNSVKDNQPPI